MMIRVPLILTSWGKRFGKTWCSFRLIPAGIFPSRCCQGKIPSRYQHRAAGRVSFTAYDRVPVAGQNISRIVFCHTLSSSII